MKTLSRLVLVLLAVAVVLAPPSTRATTRTVTSLADSGPGTLRTMIAASLANDSIDFAVTGTITLTNSELLIGRDLTITGPGANLLAVSGHNAHRVFRITNAIVNMSGLTIRNGLAVGTNGPSGGEARGGGIYNQPDSTLALTSCTIVANTARGGSGTNSGNSGGNGVGGGIWSQSKLYLTACTIANNRAIGGSGGSLGKGRGGDGLGGGLYDNGRLALVACSISSNSAEGGQGGIDSLGGDRGGDGRGGGIYDEGWLTLTNCTLYTNKAAGGSGGHALDAGPGSAGGDGEGGGVFQSSSIYARLIACTLSGNVAVGGSGAPGYPFFSAPNGNGGNGTGGGLKLDLCIVGNSIIAGNGASAGLPGGPPTTPGSSSGPDVSGAATSSGHNFIGKTDGGSGWVGTDLTGTVALPLDPLLDPPGKNGGPTLTMFPQPSSAVIDRGDDSIATSIDFDQRGRPRKSGAHVDIGAVEVGPLFPLEVVNTNDDGSGSLREAISSSSPFEEETITFAPNVTGTITLTSGELAIDRSVNVVGPSTKALTISGNNASRVFNITGGTVNLSWLTIADGRHVGTNGASGPRGNPAGETVNGGGMINSGNLSLENCTFLHNTVIGGHGLNPPDGVDGGDGGGALGGALYNLGTLAVRNCTFVTNSAQGGTGGSIGNGDSGAPGNGGDGVGGAIYNLNSSPVTMESCTIVGNAALGGSAGFCICTEKGPTNGAGFGGAVRDKFGAFNVSSTLFAGNVAHQGPNIYGAVTSQGFNLVSATNGVSGFGLSTDQLGNTNSPINPLLRPLQDNGGPTKTMALLAGSPAIDKGNSSGVTNDQRGRERKYDFAGTANASGGDGSDIGAFELQPPLLGIARSGGNVILSWYTNDSGFTRQFKTNLNAAFNWSNVPGNPGIFGSQYAVTNGATSGNKFYRLRSP